MNGQADEILAFWDSIGPKGWYEVTTELDDTIRDKYEMLWHEARTGKLNPWLADANSALALLILTDQFPRNMFRGQANSFATDELSRAYAKKIIVLGHDQAFEGSIRQFFYLPLMHAESVSDQDSAVRAFLTRNPNEQNLRHARAHRQVIREFGRFPYRNEALGRVSSQDEIAYLKAGGYRYTLENLADLAE